MTTLMDLFKFKDVPDYEIARTLGKFVGLGKPMLCPLCSDSDGDQPMSSFGDFENELFCPHCDLGVKLVVTYNPTKS